MKNNNYSYLVKMMLIGDSNVGKSSLMLKFTDDIFDIEGCPTIGIDFKIKTTELNNNKVKIQILDTAGQERFRSITNSHYRNAMGIILVYDVCNEQSFNNIELWLDNVNKFTTGSINKILVGNKIDLSDKRVVSYERGLETATKFGLTFYETSVKDNVNVIDMFDSLALKIIDELKSKETVDDKTITLDKKLNNVVTIKKEKCC
jgi:small GTP-binding protein